MAQFIKMMTLDVLKPQEPGVDTYAEEIAGMKHIDTIKIKLMEIDTKTETVKIIVEGSGLNLEPIENKIKELGGTVHSVDEVIASEKDIEDTPINYE